jgi:beta-lactamase regulating signal transducer with metallopeptidase domain
MSAWIDSINDFSVGWAAWMWHATWQTAIVITAACLLTLALRRWSPQLRSWIWRLAYVKLLLLLVWTTPVTLAVLPPQSQQSQGSRVSSQESLVPSRDRERAEDSLASRDRERAEDSVASRNREGAEERSGFGVQGSVHSPTVSVGSQESGVRDQESGGRSQVSNIPHSPFATPHSSDSPLHPLTPSISFMLYLLLLWSCGALAVIIWLAIEIWKATRLYRSVQLIDRPELTDLVAEVRRRLGLRCNVQLGESHLAVGPMLVKFIRPMIVFPEGLLHSPSPQPSPVEGEGAKPVTGSPAHPLIRSQVQAPVTNVPGSPLLNTEPRTLNPSSPLSENDIRLVLAHELAHVKRHDLAWNALAAAVHCVLYFHPFVWFAHRFARQEQEMACDELVVTRLNVERHEYGQLLVKIVRQVAGKFPSTLATVAMSNSYQTLSRRLTAMQQFRQFTRKQILLAGCLLTVISVLAVVPWRLVAQESAPKTSAPAEKATSAVTPSNAPTENDSSTKESSSKESPTKESQEKLLVGVWRGGRDSDEKDIVFHDDGTYEDLDAQIMYGNGNWTIQNGLVLTNTDSSVLWKRDGKDSSKENPMQRRAVYQILRLDHDFLRLKEVANIPSEPLFFRRVEEKSADEQFAAIPAELRAIPAAARLTPEEAAALVDWFKAHKIDASKLTLIERIIQARRHKITLAEVFGMTPEEATALHDVVQQANGDYSRLNSLAARNQLSPVEVRALGKMTAVNDELTTVLRAMPMDSPTYFDADISGQGSSTQGEIRPSGYGGLVLGPGRAHNVGTAPTLPSALASTDQKLSAAQRAAFSKLNSYFTDLGRWFWNMVFAVELAPIGS